MSVPGETTGPVLACGEVRTCLLPTRDAVSGRDAERLLRLRDDERVRISQRPNPYAVSPDVLTGVDCHLPTANRARAHVVGTVAARASLTEGRMLQATAYFAAPATGPDRRRPWGYYLVRPGVLVPVGRIDARSVAQGFLTQHLRDDAPDDLDIGSIAEGLLARISRHRLLDYDVPLTSAGTSLRWSALPAADGEEASLESFTIAEHGLRLVELRLPGGVPPAVVAGLCEDLALHDWLLTTVVDKLDGVPLGSAEDAAALRRLGPLVHHLLHLWMPKARVDGRLGALWDVLEQDPGFSRQWQTLVQRIRDQLALRAAVARRHEPQPLAAS
ncbi:SCO2521 family protein [Streptomyces sp. NPDC046805]|uniref:SCO2521 family protein n=1 Tax=Streptomyces sp. NPDC046805 TaxID=3155134 RepID=UPI003409E5B8